MHSVKDLVKIGAENVIKNCLRINRNENILLITDSYDFSIVESLADTIIYNNGNPVILKVSKKHIKKNIFSKALYYSMEYSPAIIMCMGIPIVRTPLTINALNKGSRIIILNKFTKQMLGRKSLRVDFPKISELCFKVASLLTRAATMKITTNLGTNLFLNLKNRKGNALTGIPKSGEIHCVPNIEANIAPIEETTEGIIFIDGSIPHLNLAPIKNPIKIKIHNGKIDSISGNFEAQILLEKLKSIRDENSSIVGEMGIGLNPMCELIGVPVEDEGKLGTAHIAVGNNILFGGENKAKIHYDLVFNYPTIEIDGHNIMLNGKLLI